MPRPGDRRPLICDCAITLLADGGARALTHGAVDRAAGLPKGSTSYYFRTRDALISATIERIRAHSRDAMNNAEPIGEISVDAAAVFIAEQLAAFTGVRRPDAIAVFALLPEVRENDSLRTELSSCLFSLDRATALLEVLGSSTPREDAADLIAFLSGMLFDTFFGIRSRAVGGVRPASESVARLLRQMISTAR
ncbi:MULTISPECIES: TetR/AcrR family transcriptional regulator [unclassified Gordonia (in: high G+C Gram-positive bacteria)]|uniref:TetR/AcrR family transcriptional regulator n=1 Tax=unclassified Gordonia (in: high G+C Gram-positive bacteria) TaxID=2657482 RepID=UPI0007EBA089|nr:MULTISPECIES: TetR family transcriptional regulator [unclassified Gordonia (in: high G+C Gram-positive bacteria)]OBC10845.1 TetR family transcriptional regulator [Gordonia sp. 852002-50395_SCH5434458]OBC20653.1 TetR family transcriptional regulator [Gordonia sp. 852002-50816_SCH5313054-a]OBC21117.1 TetR family transcriptional regulator [Gordonia sp. 852002-50816_SCH5313054-c]